jgi:glycosyltransferase involved in cell wall biosynthesis
VHCIRPDGHIIPISDRLRLDPRVNILERRLSNREYSSYFSVSDFIVMPYRKSTYYNRISGVAVEAALSGKPMIVTENTWLSWAVSKFGVGLSVAESDADAWSMAIERCLSERSALQSEAQSRVTVAKQYNSSERYLEILWAGL